MKTATERNDDFRDLVKKMRSAQKEYFKTRSRTALGLAKDLEKQVDLYLASDTKQGYFSSSEDDEFDDEALAFFSSQKDEFNDEDVVFSSSEDSENDEFDDGDLETTIL